MTAVNWFRRRFIAPRAANEKQSSLAAGGGTVSSKEIFQRFHEEFVHKLRNTADYICNSKIELAHESARWAMADLCEGAALSIKQALPSDGQVVHCTLKVVVESSDDPLIACVGRSLSGGKDGRDPLFGLDNARKASENTPFVALVGGSDGKTNWHVPFPSFSCNDLTKYPDFVCARQSYSNYYRSVLVFPLRFRSSNDGHHILGVLTFDTEGPNGFPDLTDTFKYLHNPEASRDDYRKDCRSVLCWTIGASMADTIATCFRPYARTNSKLQEYSKSNE